MNLTIYPVSDSVRTREMLSMYIVFAPEKRANIKKNSACPDPVDITSRGEHFK